MLVATVYDCFTLKSFDLSFHSPSAFCTVGTENAIVISSCNTDIYLEKMHIGPYLLCGAINSMHEMEKESSFIIF